MKEVENQPSSTHTKKRSEKFRYCNVVVSSTYENYDLQVQQLISIGQNFFDWYAYIFHEPEPSSSDLRDTSRHFHILYYSRSPLSTRSILKRFSGVVPDNLVEFTMSGPGFARYLTHKNRPEKIQYSDSDVVTSDKDKYFSLVRNSRPDSLDLWVDFKRLRVGLLTPEEFLDKYRSEMASMPFYQRYSMYHKIYDTCGSHYFRSASISYDTNPPNIKYRDNNSGPSKIDAEIHTINNNNRKDAHGNTKTN